jgi:enolase
MKLETLIKEMSLPTVNNTEQAIDIIRQAYQSAIVKKQPNVDLYGSLHAAINHLMDDPGVLKYKKYIDMAKAAKKAMVNFRSKVSQHDKKFTTMQKRLDVKEPS